MEAAGEEDMNWGGGGMGGDMGKGGVDRMKYIVLMYESLKKKTKYFLKSSLDFRAIK